MFRRHIPATLAFTILAIYTIALALIFVRTIGEVTIMNGIPIPLYES